MKCKNKKTYFSENEAKHALKRMNKISYHRKQGYDMYGIRAYKCHVCGHYHLGHRPSLQNLEMIRLQINPSVLEWKEFIMKEIFQEQYHMDAGQILTNQRRIA